MNTICPVCNESHEESERQCQICGFLELGKIFPTEEDAKHFYNTVVVPYGQQYIWYVSYGASLLKERFMKYIEGGSFREITKKYEGCKDNKSVPLKDKPFLIPHELYFGNKSINWKGGVAFISSNTSGTTLGRAYLITKEQFNQIQEQENNSDKWYGNIVELTGDGGVIPYKTFTQNSKYRENNPPTLEYLNTVMEGLCEIYPQLNIHYKFSRLLNEAIKHIGKPYKLGGDGSDGTFDCSGFVRYVYQYSGIYEIPKCWRRSWELINAFEIVDFTEKREGDVLFLIHRETKKINHVAIYIGNDKVIHATSSLKNKYVCISDITEDFKNRIIYVGRYGN